MATDFIADPYNLPTPQDKNLILSQYLNGPWRDLNIIKIDRIEITPKGWQVTYKT
jgi:hypothetical protein